jgi:NAD(P)-dependent dehydrogenase (short-subunit alcohol dehydrogenase family)
MALCRHGSSQLVELGATVISGVDLGRPDDLVRLASRLADRRVDALIHVAGILSKETLGEIDSDAIERIEAQFRVNALGPVLLTQALLGNLAEGSKVIILTSRMGSIADNSSGGSYGYRMSKAAVNAAGVSLARDLAPRGICVGIIHPGYVRTDMTGGQGLMDADESAAGILKLLDALSTSNSGGFWHVHGDELPW